MWEWYLLIIAWHSTPSFLQNLSPSSMISDWGRPCADGFSTFWGAGPRWWALAVTRPPRCSRTGVHHRAVCSVPSCTPCSHMTVLLNTSPTLLLSLLTTEHSWALLRTMLWQNTKRSKGVHPDSNLSLNVSKTQKMIVDYRRQQGGTPQPIYISDAEVERVISLTLLCVNVMIIMWASPGQHT